jgi:hypothetical protein
VVTFKSLLQNSRPLGLRLRAVLTEDDARPVQGARA